MSKRGKVAPAAAGVVLGLGLLTGVVTAGPADAAVCPTGGSTTCCAGTSSGDPSTCPTTPDTSNQTVSTLGTDDLTLTVDPAAGTLSVSPGDSSLSVWNNGQDPESSTPDSSQVTGQTTVSEQYAPEGTSQTPPVTADDSGYTAAASDSGQYSCYRTTVPGAKLRGYAPRYATHNGDRAYIQFEFALYTVDDARWFTDEGYTFQQNLCSTGGAKSKNGWRLNMAGVGMTSDNKATRIIDRNWETGSVKGSDTVTLGFKVTKGPVEVSAGLNITASHKWVGGQGPYWAVGKKVNSYANNEVYGYWDGRDQVRNNHQGSDDYEGTSVLSLWEWPENFTGSFSLPASIYWGTNCPNSCS